MYFNSTSADFFGKRLREIRVKSGLSQQTLSSELGVSKAALCYYESGKRIPDIVFLEHVAKYFDVSLEYLLGFTDAMNPQRAKLVDYVGLSEESVELLGDSHECVVEVLDLLIKNTKFINCLEMIEIASHDPDIAKENQNTDTMFTDYYASGMGLSFISYIIERFLIEAIAEIISGRNSALGAQLLKKIVPDKEKKFFYQWLCSTDGYLNIDDRISELDKERTNRFQQLLAKWKEDTKTRDEAVRNLKGSDDDK